MFVGSLLRDSGSYISDGSLHSWLFLRRWFCGGYSSRVGPVPFRSELCGRHLCENEQHDIERHVSSRCVLCITALCLSWLSVCLACFIVFVSLPACICDVRYDLCFHLLCVCTCAGHYCPEGSPSPVQCPPGTNTTSVGLRSVGDCGSCVKGYYCPSNGTVLSEKKCLAGMCGYEYLSSSVCLCPPMSV